MRIKHFNVYYLIEISGSIINIVYNLHHYLFNHFLKLEQNYLRLVSDIKGQKPRVRNQLCNQSRGWSYLGCV